MAQRDWQSDDLRRLGIFLNGQETGLTGPGGEPQSGSSFVLLVNPDPELVTFRLPPRRFGLEWALELSTAHP